jgi:hypothetical protein
VNRNVRILLAVVLVAGAGFGYWHFLLAPKRAEADRLARKAATAQAQLAQAQATIATYQKARADYASNFATVVRLGKAVPADDDTRSLVVQLNAAASRSGVDFSSVQLNGSASTPAPAGVPGAAPTDLPPGAVQVGSAGFSEMPFSLAFQGTFEGLEGFFGRLERFVTLKGNTVEVSGRLLRVESVQISPGDKGFPSLKATINASSYLTPAQQGLTSGATPAGPAGGTTASSTSTTTSTGVAG